MRNDMDRQAAKDLLYGGILELLQNSTYFDRSIGPEYSRWTERGVIALTEYMRVMGCLMIHTERADLDKRAKDMVINTLKGDTI